MILWCDFCFVKPHKTSASGDNIRVYCPVTAWEPLVALTALSALLSAQAGGRTLLAGMRLVEIILSVLLFC